jgi:hypothetical protein
MADTQAQPCRIESQKSKNPAEFTRWVGWKNGAYR